MTDEHMKEKLSALVDNELDELEERRVRRSKAMPCCVKRGSVITWQGRFCREI